MCSFPRLPTQTDSLTTRSLNLLFILQEWVFAVKELEQTEEKTSSFAKALDRLIAPRRASLLSPGGILDKLHFHITQLLETSKIQGEKLLSLLEDVQTQVLQLKVQYAKNRAADGKSVLTALKKSLREIFLALIPYFCEARTNENFLISLLEQKETIDHTFEAPMVETLMQQFFPEGISHLRAILFEGFSRRGFTAFFQEKEPLLEKLDLSE